MRKLLIGLLILGGVLAAIAVMKRRSGSDVEEWDSFAADDSYSRASMTATKVADAAEDAAATTTNAVKDAASTTTKAAKDAASTATKATKDAAAKATDAVKDA